MSVPDARHWSTETLLEVQSMAGVRVWEWRREDSEQVDRDLDSFLTTVVPEDRQRAAATEH